MSEEPNQLSRGWSLTLGELRKAIDGLPDDYEVMLCNAEVDDIEIEEAQIDGMYPPSATGSPGLFILRGGQIITSEYDYHNRMDAHHALGGDSWWSPDKQQWVKQ